MSNSKDRRTGWLANLNVGDQVIVDLLKVRQVEKITPTGQITVDGVRYDHRGDELGKPKFSFGDGYEIYEYNNENKKRMEKNKAIKALDYEKARLRRCISCIDWGKITEREINELKEVVKRIPNKEKNEN